jgi:putative restriction endonuclease
MTKDKFYNCSRQEVERFLEQYNDTHSTSPGDYRTLSYLASYIVGLIQSDEDTRAIIESAKLTATEKEQLFKSRIGQGRFRKGLIRHWGKKCCLTGCALVPVLRASHIKPWAKCNDKEKLDTYNGLLLAPHIGALFDQGLISFENDGKLIISQIISEKDAEVLLYRCEDRIKVKEHHATYLEYHREKIYGSKLRRAPE